MAYPYENKDKGLSYPLTKMNFRVSVNDINASAAFSQVTGIEATVDVIEFRQGNAHSMSPVKIPGLVKHGNVTLKFGYTLNNEFKTWLMDCVTSTRASEMPRHNVQIELIDINPTTPQTLSSTIESQRVWILSNAWVAKYTAPELDAKTSDVAIETVEVAYEELTIPNV